MTSEKQHNFFVTVEKHIFNETASESNSDKLKNNADLTFKPFLTKLFQKASCKSAAPNKTILVKFLNKYVP